MLASDYLFLGLDSAVVGLAAGPLLVRRRSRIALAVACGVADGLGSTFGALMGRPWSDSEGIIPAVLLMLYGLGILVGAATLLRHAERRQPEAGRARTLPGLSLGTCVVLPVLLSIDNIIYPTPSLDAATTVALAASSAALMLAGLAAGRSVAQRWSPMAALGVRDLWAGAGFVVAGLVVMVA